MMSSIICGLPLRKCLRISAVVGICLSIIYIMLGTIIMTSTILQPPRFNQNDSLNEIYYKIMVYRGNDFLLRILTVILLIVNLIQIISDLFIIDGSFKGKYGKHYWLCFIVDIILWLISLICYVMIFYGSGFLLLIIVLFGTAVRGFILYLLHEFITYVRKANDSVEEVLEISA